LSLAGLPTIAAVTAELTLPAGGRLVLHDPFFEVVAGRVEIYAVSAGRRRFLAEMRTGAWLFGGSAGLVALAPEGAILRVPPAHDVLSLAADPLLAGPLITSLDAWISGLSEGLSRMTPSRPDIRGLQVGDPIVAAEAATDGPATEALSAAHGVVWIASPDLSLRFMSIGAPERGPIPVTSSTWVLRTRTSAAQADLTCALVRHQDWLNALDAFHRGVLDVLDHCAAQAHALEVQRVAEREALTAADLDGVARRLAEVLDDRPAKGTVARDDNAFVVTQLVRGFTLAPTLASMLDFPAYVEAAGLRSRVVALTADWSRGDHGPLAGKRLSDGRWVALVPDWLGRYRMEARGEASRLVDAALAADLERHALALLQPLPSRKLRTWEIAVVGLALCRADIATVAIAGLAASLLGIALPMAMGMLIDEFVPGQLRGPTLLLGAAVALLTLCNALLHISSDLARLRIDGKLSSVIQAGIVDRVLRLPTKVLRSLNSADLSMRILSVEQMRRLITGMGLNTLMAGVFGLSNLAVLLFYDLRAGTVAAGLFAALVTGAIATGIAQLRALNIGEVMTANIIAQTLQLVQNVATLRAFGAESRAFVNWARNTAAMRSRMLRSRRTTIAFECLLSGYDVLALAAVFAVLGFSAGGHRLTIGAYFAFIGIYEAFLFASEGLARAAMQLIGMQPLVRRAALILDTAPESPPAAADPGTLAGAIEASALTFAYAPGATPILQEVSFRVEPGHLVAVVGPSGCGKSTLVNLLLGFDRPQAGTVLFDGRELGSLDRAAVRRQIGIVRQNGRLLAGSIYENILGLHSGTPEDAWTAADLAGVADDIRALPMGMHTVINEGVPTFSGGQIQRLLIARALAGKPRILIFDEATSALDNRAQAEVTGNVERLGITRIVVAHRLSTVRNADVIHFLEAGRIVESGTFDALLETDGRFAAFARRQFL